MARIFTLDRQQKSKVRSYVYSPTLHIYSLLCGEVQTICRPVGRTPSLPPPTLNTLNREHLDVPVRMSQTLGPWIAVVKLHVSSLSSYYTQYIIKPKLLPSLVIGTNKIYELHDCKIYIKISTFSLSHRSTKIKCAREAKHTQNYTAKLILTRKEPSQFDIKFGQIEYTKLCDKTTANMRYQNHISMSTRYIIISGHIYNIKCTLKCRNIIR
jgi:hypothetical protein